MVSADSRPVVPANDQGSHQRVIKIDPDGDLTLVVGSNKARFLVCSKALSRSAPFWKRCLYGQFKEAKPAADQEWVVEFPEDNPFAMRYVLLLVHGFGDELPEVDLRFAFDITVLTNKYGMTRHLWAVARSWLHDVAPKPLHEYDANDTIVPQLAWLWVTKELGALKEHENTFAELSQSVATSTAEGDAHLLLRPFKCDDGTTLTRESLEGYEAEKDVLFHFIGEIMSAREAALSAIRRVLKRDIKTLRDIITTFDSYKGCAGTTLCAGHGADRFPLPSEKQRLCEYAMQAIVTKFATGKDSPVKPIAKISVSVLSYLNDVSWFTSRIESELVLVSGDGHSLCTPFTSGRPTQEALENDTRMVWWRKNHEAFESQARVSGLKKGEGRDDNKD